MKVLVVDVGGTHIKAFASGEPEPRRTASAPDLTPDELVKKVHELAKGWNYEAVSLGYPGLVGPHGPTAEPGNLGDGWVGFDFARAFGCPVKVVNDAVMQALGSYEGGRMLFLSLGTGVGSTLVCPHALVQLELGTLPFRDATLAEWLGRAGFKKRGKETWQQAVAEAVPILKKAFVADHVMLGGGNVEEIESLPEGARRGGNDKAFEGGFRLWETTVHPIDPSPAAHLVWRLI